MWGSVIVIHMESGISKLSLNCDLTVLFGTNALGTGMNISLIHIRLWVKKTIQTGLSNFVGRKIKKTEDNRKLLYYTS